MYYRTGVVQGESPVVSCQKFLVPPPFVPPVEGLQCGAAQFLVLIGACYGAFLRLPYRFNSIVIPCLG